jgi:acetyl-CoA C-acetyltransferase
MDVFESNEVFSAQAICVANELHFPEEKINPNDGAIYYPFQRDLNLNLTIY